LKFGLSDGRVKLGNSLLAVETMMQTFKEWLAEEASKDPGASERKRKIADWKRTVTELRDQILEWLEEDDPNRTLYVERQEITRGEEGLGWYRVPALRLSIGGRAVDIAPLSRNVAGRVVLKNYPEFHPGGLVGMSIIGRTHYIYLHETEAEKKWLIGKDSGSYRELTKDTFESALMDLLS